MNQYFNEAFQQMLIDRALREGMRGRGRLLPHDWRYGVSLGAESPDPRNFNPTYRERVPGPQSSLEQPVSEIAAPPASGIPEIPGQWDLQFDMDRQRWLDQPDRPPAPRPNDRRRMPLTPVG